MKITQSRNKREGKFIGYARNVDGACRYCREQVVVIAAERFYSKVIPYAVRTMERGEFEAMYYVDSNTQSCEVKP